MNSLAAYAIAKALIDDPIFDRRSSSGPGIRARVRRLIRRPSPAMSSTEPWIEVPRLTGYPTSR